MAKFLFIFFLTFVLIPSLSLAAPRKKMTPVEEKVQPQPDNIVEKKSLSEENLSPSKQFKKIEKTQIQHNYPYTQAISTTLGLLADVKKVLERDKKDVLGFVFSAKYMLKRFSSPKLELGAALLSTSSGLLSVDKRFIQNELTSFRPYYSFGAAMKVNAEQGFATFTELKNYMLKVNIGLEDYLSGSLSSRIEAETFLSTKEVLFFLNFGTSFGF